MHMNGVGVGRFTTKKAVVSAALYAKLLSELLEMQGKVPWVGNLDALRAHRVAAPPTVHDRLDTKSS